MTGIGRRLARLEDALPPREPAPQPLTPAQREHWIEAVLRTVAPEYREGAKAAMLATPPSTDRTWLLWAALESMPADPREEYKGWLKRWLREGGFW